MTKDEAREILENWQNAGKLAGAAFAAEMDLLSRLQLVDKIAEKRELTKEAKGAILKKLLARGARPAALALGVGGLGAGGFAIGAKKEKEKADERLQEIAPKIFQVGFVQGARRGYIAGAQKGFEIGRQRGAVAGAKKAEK